MGYDFEALEDGEITFELRNHAGIKYPNDVQRATFIVKKGTQYSYEISGAELRER